jgi:hypothetical protein
MIKIISFILLLTLMTNVEAVNDLSTLHVRYCGDARNQHGVVHYLYDGWYELQKEDTYYTYILMDRNVYKIAKHKGRTKRTKVKRYDHYYPI